MNDEFLYRLRVSPPPQFAARLKLRLDAEAASQASRRTHRRLYMIAGLFVAGTALALVSPTVRHYTVQIFRGDNTDRSVAASAQAAPPLPARSVASPFGSPPSSQELTTTTQAPQRDMQDSPLTSASPPGAANAPASNAAPLTAESSLSIAHQSSGIAPRSISVITMEDSRSLAPLTEKVAAQFQQTIKTAEVSARHTDTSTAFGRLCRREIDLLHSVRPIGKTERATCTSLGTEYAEIPVAYEAVVIVGSPLNDWANGFNRGDLWKIDAGQPWSAIDPAWPNRRTRLYGVKRSGATRGYVSEPLVLGWSEGIGMPVATVGDLTTNLARDRDAIAYLSYSEFEPLASKLKALGIINSHGVVVFPSRTTLDDASYEPLSRLIFLYVNANSIDRPEVGQFVQFYLRQGATAIAEAKFTPLASRAYAKALQNFQDRKMGTVFTDEPAVGVPVEQLLEREARRFSL